MDKWEYKILREGVYRDYSGGNIETVLNEWGQKGWELICIDGTSYYLKRKVQS